MAKLDTDVRNLISHLYFHVSGKWNDMMNFLWSPDTQPDADLWVESKPDTDEVQLKEEIREFVIQADAQMKQLPGHEFVFGYPIRDKPREQGDPRQCFLAMPTRAWLPDVQRAIESAAAPAFKCVLSVDNANPGDIMDQVWGEIRRSEVVVADLTEQNPNVFYEMGLAHALGKPIIIIVQDSALPVPFDLSKHRYVPYHTGDLGALEAELTDAFLAVPPRYEFDPHQ